MNFSMCIGSYDHCLDQRSDAFLSTLFCVNFNFWKHINVTDMCKIKLKEKGWGGWTKAESNLKQINPNYILNEWYKHTATSEKEEEEEREQGEQTTYTIYEHSILGWKEGRGREL